jgi:hypothetical protein
MTGRSKGYGFVRFTSEPERDKALGEMQSYPLNGRNLRCRCVVVVLVWGRWVAGVGRGLCCRCGLCCRGGLALRSCRGRGSATCCVAGAAG